jgi:hypothetical protein
MARESSSSSVLASCYAVFRSVCGSGLWTYTRRLVGGLAGWLPNLSRSAGSSVPTYRDGRRSLRPPKISPCCPCAPPATPCSPLFRLQFKPVLFRLIQTPKLIFLKHDILTWTVSCRSLEASVWRLFNCHVIWVQSNLSSEGCSLTTRTRCC